MHGTGWIVRILPFIEAGRFPWDYRTNVIGNAVEVAGTSPSQIGNKAGTAVRDLEGFYCPTRRGGIRPNTDANMLMLGTSQAGGGTDYGGCAGRYIFGSVSGTGSVCTPSRQLWPAGRWNRLPYSQGSQ